MTVEQKFRGVATPVPAATMLLLRDGDAGLEVFLVERNQNIDFGGGALVFPGGKTGPDDYDPALASLVDGAEVWSGEARAVAVSAIREAFEEAGVLLARDASDGEFVSAERLAHLDRYREDLELARVGLADFVRRENLRLACDELVPFAHWITPRSMRKRFDTHFFLARIPLGHAGQHCGRESVASTWVRPAEAVEHDTLGKLLFPTRMNLMKLARARNVDEALCAARAAPPATVEPWMENTPEGKFVCIRDDAGYEGARFPFVAMP
jgi:8-oxo-dGTP pyrophosphatase MutT (NUDIX family)